MASQLALFWKQLRALLYKNFLLKIRNPLGTIGTLLLPLHIILVLLLVGAITTITIVGEPHFEAVPAKLDCTNNACKKLALSPSALTTVRKLASEITLRNPGLHVQLFEKPEDYLPQYKQYIANVHFTQTSARESIGYTIWNRTEIDLSNQTRSFVQSDFIAVQNVIQDAIATSKFGIGSESGGSGESSGITLNIKTKQFPRKPYTQVIENILQFLIPIYFSIGLLHVFQQHVVQLVTEKEQKLKSGLRMMGCMMSAYNVSWYIVTMIEFFIALIITTIACYTFGILQATNVTVFLTVYFLYLLSLIPLAHIFAVFFENPKVASFVSYLLLFLTIPVWVVLRLFVFSRMSSDYDWLQYLSNFISPIAFTEFMFHVGLFEDLQIEMTFATINASLYETLYSLKFCIVYLAADVVIYLLLSLYLERVIPDSNSIASPPLFFIKSFTSLFRRSNRTNEQTEESPANKGIVIENLTKIYKNSLFNTIPPTVAVDSVSINITKGNIFALLGQNGVGKTTTINVITGTTAATAGKVTVGGFDVSTDITQVREWLGICPQHNILFDKLTVSEHLSLFGSIRGIHSKLLKAEISQRLNEVMLADKANALSETLSGGMKRKLSVAMALIGDAPIIILDEPTSGMDPISRRSIWNILQEAKKDRVIVLTTHSMEEADLLGDTIAIMRRGKIECSGDSLTLKNHYGVGYNLHCVVQPDFDVAQITQFVQGFIPEAQPRADQSGLELVFVLPYNTVKFFPDFLENLQTEMPNLKISSFGLSITTLEEVFLRVNAAEETEPAQVETENEMLS